MRWAGEPKNRDQLDAIAVEQVRNGSDSTDRGSCSTQDIFQHKVKRIC